MFRGVKTGLGCSQGPKVKSVTLQVMTSGSPVSIVILSDERELSICG